MFFGKKLKSGLSLDSYIDFRTGETVYTICDNIGLVFSTIFPSKLEKFYAKNCIIKSGISENLKTKSCKFVKKWRIVDENDRDLVLPYFDSLSDAKNMAEDLEYNIMTVLKD